MIFQPKLFVDGGAKVRRYLIWVPEGLFIFLFYCRGVRHKWSTQFDCACTNGTFTFTSLRKKPYISNKPATFRRPSSFMWMNIKLSCPKSKLQTVIYSIEFRPHYMIPFVYCTIYLGFQVAELLLIVLKAKGQKTMSCIKIFGLRR